MKDHILNALMTFVVCIVQRLVFPTDGWPTFIEVGLYFLALSIYDEVKK